MKGYIDPYFYTTPSEQWNLSTFITTYNGSSLVKEKILYFYKEGLLNICQSSDFSYEQKETAENLIDSYRADKKECAYLFDVPKSKSVKTAILQNRVSILHYLNEIFSLLLQLNYVQFELLIESAKSANATLNATFIEADASVSEYQSSDQQVRSTNYESNPFNTGFSQKRKYAFDTEEEEDSGEEYNADKTIVGGRNTTWVVDGINIRQKLTIYQEEKNLTKSKPEYYDVIFFNNKNQDGFLGTLPESTIIKMNKEIMEEIKGAEEEDIRSLLSKIIDRDIHITKENLKEQQNHNDSFEKEFALYFINHMWVYIFLENR